MVATNEQATWMAAGAGPRCCGGGVPPAAVIGWCRATPLENHIRHLDNMSANVCNTYSRMLMTWWQQPEMGADLFGETVGACLVPYVAVAGRLRVCGDAGRSR